METTELPVIVARKWYQIWWQVWQHPGVDSFVKILQDPAASERRGFAWVAAAGLAAALLSLVFTLLTPASSASAKFLPYAFCGVIAGPIFAVIGLALGAAITHGIAQVFKGSGKWAQMVYCLAVIQAPLILLGAVDSLLSVLGPAVSILLDVVSIALGILSLVLDVNAIDAVEDIGTGKSIVVLLAPAIMVIVLGVCAALVLAPAMSR